MEGFLNRKGFLFYVIMENLELKHLAPYLPYGLECYFSRNTTYKLTALGKDSDDINKAFFHFSKQYTVWYQLNDFKPILRPLSDLTKEIEHNGENFVPVQWLRDKFYTLSLDRQCFRIIEDERWINSCDYLLIKYLLEWHFDVFGLIESGLAIDKNTL